MKKIVTALLVFAVAGAGALCFAQPVVATAQTAPAAPIAANETGPKMIAGKIDTVTIADPAKGTKSEVIVADEAGTKTAVLVKATTTIYDVDWKPLTLDKLAKDQRVKVKYSMTKEGVNEALSVSIIK